MTISEIEPNLTQCRWDWCTRNFNTNAEMRDHVLQDHIAHAKPVRRGDVPVLRRVWLASQVQTEPSPSDTVPLSFTALRTDDSAALAFGPRNTPLVQRSFPMDQDSQGAFKPDTSYDAMALPVTDPQWWAQLQLSLDSVDSTTVRPSQTLVRTGRLEEVVKPPASYSTSWDLTESPDSSAAKWANGINEDHVTSPPSSQSSSQSSLAGMSHSQDLGSAMETIEQPTTPQAPLRNSYLSF